MTNPRSATTSLLDFDLLNLPVIIFATHHHERNFQCAPVQLRAGLKIPCVKRHILLELHARCIPRMQDKRIRSSTQSQRELVSITLGVRCNAFRRNGDRRAVIGADSETSSALRVRRTACVAASSRKHRQRFERANFSLCVIRLISNSYALTLQRRASVKRSSWPCSQPNRKVRARFNMQRQLSSASIQFEFQSTHATQLRHHPSRLARSSAV